MNGDFSCLLGNTMSILQKGPYPVSFSGCYNCGLYIGCITNVNLQPKTPKEKKNQYSFTNMQFSFPNFQQALF